jgi:hypothetical protein
MQQQSEGRRIRIHLAYEFRQDVVRRHAHAVSLTGRPSQE